MRIQLNNKMIERTMINKSYDLDLKNWSLTFLFLFLNYIHD